MSFFSQPAAKSRPLGLALAAGFGVAVACAIAWGLITYLIKHEFSVIAVGLGLAVGATVAKLRPGDMAAAVGSGLISLAGAILGSVFAAVFILVNAGVGVSVLLAHLGTVLSITFRTEGFLGYLFWGLAAVFGFRIPMQVARARNRAAAAAPVPSPFMAPQDANQPAFPAGQPPFQAPSPYMAPPRDDSGQSSSY